MKTQALKSIYLFYILQFAVCISSNAQIIYTDIIPDTSINYTGTYKLDLDNDGNEDFILSNAYQYLGFCGNPWHGGFPKLYRIAKVNALSSTNLFANLNSNPACFSYGDLIDGTLNWSSGIFTDTLRAFLRPLCNPGTFIGNWGLTVDRYLPLKKTVGINNYYGWVRMIVCPGPSYSIFTIKDYAYDSIPNQPIFAGDTGLVSTSIIQQLDGMQLFTIYPNPLTNSTTISFSLSQSENVSLKIFDFNSRLITTLADNIFEAGEHSLEWNAEKINAGIYFLKMEAGEFLKQEKIIVTK